jgi:predicted unusual protein kinase regulating ubiquinone biosynthesis (AarF/ABC1/UbiB family)
MDPYFANFPASIHPQAKSSASVQPQAKGLKRGFEEAQDATDVAKHRLAEEMLTKQRNEAMLKVNESRKKELAAEQAKLSVEQERLVAETRTTEQAVTIRNLTSQVEQLRRLKDERDAKVSGFDQEISTREDVVARRVASEHQALFDKARSDLEEKMSRVIKESISNIFERLIDATKADVSDKEDLVDVDI